MAPTRDGPHYKILMRELLNGPRTVEQLKLVLDVHATTVKRQLAIALGLEHVHIKSWTRAKDGPPIALYALGMGKSARRPRPYTIEQRSRMKRARLAKRGDKFEGSSCGRCGGTIRYVSNKHCVNCKGTHRDGTARQFSNRTRDLKHRKKLMWRLGESW